MKTNILKVFGFAALLGVAQGAFATVVTTEAQLEAALAAGGTVTLGADIALTHEHQVGNTVVLDLATYCLTAADGVNAFQVIANGNFTVNADETNPGGIYTSTNNSCVYTAYGLSAGQKSVTLNGGVFEGNCVFNISPTAAANAGHFGIDVTGAGTGGKSVPTTVVINGGTFQGGCDLGNVGCYQCYYFTVNGGTFERGLDSADTTTCSIGVTTTCKAFFKGGRYRGHYPCDRIASEAGKVIIGDGYTTYIYYISGDYVCIAPNDSVCEVSGRYKGLKVQECGVITYLFTQCHQEWVTPKRTGDIWNFKTYSDAVGCGATEITPLHDEGAQSQSQSGAPARKSVMKASAAPKLLASAPMLLAANSESTCPAAKGNSEDDVLVSAEKPEGVTNWDKIKVSSIADFSEEGENFGEVEYLDYETDNSEEEGCKNDFEDYYFFLTRTDLDCCYVFSRDAGAQATKELVDAGNFDDYAEKMTRLVVTFDKPIESDIEICSFAERGAKDEGLWYQYLEGANRQTLVAGTKTCVLNYCPFEARGLPFWQWFQGGDNKFNVGKGRIAVAVRNVDKTKNNGVKVSVALKTTSTFEELAYEQKPETFDILRASFTHGLGESGFEPAPLVEKEAEVVVPKTENLWDGNNAGLKIVEVQDDGSGQDIVVDRNHLDDEPRNATVAKAVYDLNMNTVAPTMADEETGLGEVPVEEDESPATEDKSKFLKINLTGIAVLKPVVVEEKSVAPLGAVEYDVTPKLKTITTVEEVKEVSEREITNDEIAQSGKSITFKLPLTDDFRVSAKVRHESEDQNYPPEEFICPVQGVAGGRYVEITTTHFSTFILSPYNAVVTESDETLGIVKVAKTAGGETVAGVPFRKFDVTSGTAKAMTVDQLLVAGFGQDDDIYAYNPTKPSGDEYDMWAWDGEKWDIVPGPTQPPAAESAEIASGKAFWFKDESGSTTPLTLAGLYQENVMTTTDAGTAGVPKMTLLVNPYNVPVNATEKIATGAATGDQIVFVNGSGRYEFKEGEGWGTVQATEKTVTIGGQTRTVRGPDQFVAVESGLIIPAGQAFWYVSKGGNPTVAW